MPSPDKVVQLADNMRVEWDRLGTLGRDIEDKDWEAYDALHEELWRTPARSIAGVIAKALVLDQRLRVSGDAHSTLKPKYAWQVIDDLLALGATAGRLN